MRICSICIAVTVSLSMVVTVLAAENTAPVRMGCGLMTFDTVPGWGLGPNGKSVLGPTHGAVVIDKAGNIYTSANIGVFVFSPAGKVIRKFLGKDYTNIHDVEVRQEGGDELLPKTNNGFCVLLCSAILVHAWKERESGAEHSIGLPDPIRPRFFRGVPRRGESQW